MDCPKGTAFWETNLSRKIKELCLGWDDGNLRDRQNREKDKMSNFIREDFSGKVVF